MMTGVTGDLVGGTGFAPSERDNGILGMMIVVSGVLPDISAETQKRWLFTMVAL